MLNYTVFVRRPQVHECIPAAKAACAEACKLTSHANAMFEWWRVAYNNTLGTGDLDRYTKSWVDAQALLSSVGVTIVLEYVDDGITLPCVLDVCCGTKMFWFDKGDLRAIHSDCRKGVKVVPDGLTFRVSPDVISDFTSLPWGDSTFYHVVFDPPHYTSLTWSSGIMAWKYGHLKTGWQDMIRKGFSECFRVLRPGGTLIFKWCDTDISIAQVLALTDVMPLYGHRSGAKSKTHWVSFIKPLTYE